MGAPMGDWVENSAALVLGGQRVEDAAGAAVTGLTLYDFKVLLWNSSGTIVFRKAAGTATIDVNTVAVTVTEYADSYGEGYYRWNLTPNAADLWLIHIEYPTRYVIGGWFDANARVVLLDNLDAAVSSRSNHGDPDPSGYLDVAVSSRSSHTAANVWAVATRTLTSFGTLAADIWNRLTSALTTVGSIGKLVVDNVNATISSRSSHGDPDPSGYIAELGPANIPADVDAIKAKTDLIGTSVATDIYVVHIGVASTGTIWYFSAHLELNGQVITSGGTAGTLDLYDIDGAQVGS
ncbi:hypothetical protein LCGC14_2286650, partial [marine sediment metagenome]